MRGHVRKRRTWEFIVDIGPHPVTGKRRQKSKGGFATKKDAESALREFIRYIEGGGDPCPERISLAVYLLRWLDFQQLRGIRSRTLDAYEGYIRMEIIPVIGGLELANVRPAHIRAVLAAMQQRGLSAATIAQVRSVLGSALRQAVADGLITSNPIAAVRRPRVQRRELHWPTSAQLGALLKVLRGTLWEVPVLLAAVTGARRSEILGLSWADVDPRAGTIFIRRGVQPVRGPERTDTIAFTPLKTRRARRQVQLPPFALDRLRHHRRDQLRRRAALGALWRDPLDECAQPVAMVCDRGDGFPLYQDAFTRAFKRLAAQVRTQWWCSRSDHPTYTYVLIVIAHPGASAADLLAVEGDIVGPGAVAHPASDRLPTSGRAWEWPTAKPTAGWVAEDLQDAGPQCERIDAD